LDPLEAALRGNAFNKTFSEQIMQQNKLDNMNDITKSTEESFAVQLQNKLIDALGEDKFRRGMEFLLSSTLLAYETTDDDHLLNIVEEIIGIENLQYLEDMYQLLTYNTPTCN
jgi:uncharacterized HAD superfamily protein